ncbi:MAG: hypothetical protein K1X57_15395 [Gemmataceae bacterium]|nr:hypothetical protein [Gemmataceae bacterium]
MTVAEWHWSDDAGAMLDFFWQQSEGSADSLSLRLSLHRFYLASCRGIWPLLPQEASRRGIELAEQFTTGKVTAEEVSKYNWHTEGAAFVLDYDTAPEDIARWVADVRSLPVDDLRAMLHPPGTGDLVEPRELLKRAAYFADYAMIYPRLRPHGPPPGSFRPFLSAAVLRQHVMYPDTVADE